MKTISWRNLIVTNADGDCGTLGEQYDDRDSGTLFNAVIRGGKIVEWPGVFLSAPGEDPNWDTPKFVVVDWTGFTPSGTITIEGE